MKEFIKEILVKNFPFTNINELFKNSELLQYIDYKTNAVNGNVKTRRSLANIYAIYSILYYYVNEGFYNNQSKYKNFEGFEYTKLFQFYRSLYGGEKLQNHALNSRVNGEFLNKKFSDNTNEIIIPNNGKYLIHINYLYVNGIDISLCAKQIIEQYILLLKEKDRQLILDINFLINNDYSREEKINKICSMLDENSEARMFEIVSYAILKNYYKDIKVYFGYEKHKIEKYNLMLYKTGRTNANDGGIDFVMKPVGRFFQVTEVNNYDKYLLDIDKVLHFPVTFVVKTNKSKKNIEKELKNYILKKTGGMRVLIDRYFNSIEELITINELKNWIWNLDYNSINSLLYDIKLYYNLELNL